MVLNMPPPDKNSFGIEILLVLMTSKGCKIIEKKSPSFK
jgi:hypothetical protein